MNFLISQGHAAPGTFTSRAIHFMGTPVFIRAAGGLAPDTTHFFVAVADVDESKLVTLFGIAQIPTGAEFSSCSPSVWRVSSGSSR